MAGQIAELIGFVVIIWVLYRFVRPLIQQMVTQRQNEIQQQVDASIEASRKLAEAQTRLESTEAEARREVAQIRDDARADATRISEELREQAEQEIERIRQRGEEQLAAQRDQLVRTLRAEVGGQAMDVAEVAVREVLSDEGNRSVVVDQFLVDLDNIAPRSAVPAPAGTQGGAN